MGFVGSECLPNRRMPRPYEVSLRSFCVSLTTVACSSVRNEMEGTFVHPLVHRLMELDAASP